MCTVIDEVYLYDIYFKSGVNLSTYASNMQEAEDDAKILGEFYEEEVIAVQYSLDNDED